MTVSASSLATGAAVKVTQHGISTFALLHCPRWKGKRYAACERRGSHS